MFYAHLLICTYIFASYLPVKPGLNGLEAAAPLLPVFRDGPLENLWGGGAGEVLRNMTV